MKNINFALVAPITVIAMMLVRIFTNNLIISTIALVIVWVCFLIDLRNKRKAGMNKKSAILAYTTFGLLLLITVLDIWTCFIRPY